MNKSRREFLKKVGFLSAGLGIGVPLVGRGYLTAPASKQWGMVIDIQKCLNKDVIHACIEACHREHNVPQIPDPEEEVKWLWTEKYEDVFPDEAHKRTAQFLQGIPVPVLCNHCTNPSCVRVCPTQATYKRKSDGIVMMDMHRCIGCRYCMAACPYGARSFNWRDPRPYITGGIKSAYPTRTIGVVEKCTFCEERLRAGRQPACVEAAAKVHGGEGALVFGDLSDPESDISRLLRNKYTICRKVSLGNEPNVFYIV
ncbi:MAG: sulfate reduction electron transfer complex DsrMKJOP subunit DsrO [bacterium]